MYWNGGSVWTAATAASRPPTIDDKTPARVRGATLSGGFCSTLR